MTDFEAIDRLKLLAKGGTNFSEESQTACKIALEALQERRTLEAELHSYKAMLETAKEYIAKQKAEIDRLALENDDLRVQVEIYDKDDLKWADSEIEKLKQELAKVARERDTVLYEYHQRLEDACMACDYCVHCGLDSCRQEDEEAMWCDFWEWRGVQEETT